MLTIVYCGDPGCGKIVALGPGRLWASGVRHTLMDDADPPNVLAVHEGQLHLILENETWDADSHPSMEDYMAALEAKYPKDLKA